MDVTDFVTLFQALVGIPMLIVVLINILKLFKVVKEGKAELVSQWLNALVFITLFGMVQFGFSINIVAIDVFAGSLAELGYAILALAPLAIKISGGIHGTLRGLPVVGHVYS